MIYIKDNFFGWLILEVKEIQYHCDYGKHDTKDAWLDRVCIFGFDFSLMFLELKSSKFKIKKKYKKSL